MKRCLYNCGGFLILLAKLCSSTGVVPDDCVKLCNSTVEGDCPTKDVQCDWSTGLCTNLFKKYYESSDDEFEIISTLADVIEELNYDPVECSEAADLISKLDRSRKRDISQIDGIDNSPPDIAYVDDQNGRRLRARYGHADELNSSGRSEVASLSDDSPKSPEELSDVTWPEEAAESEARLPALSEVLGFVRESPNSVTTSLSDIADALRQQLMVSRENDYTNEEDFADDEGETDIMDQNAPGIRLPVLWSMDVSTIDILDFPIALSSGLLRVADLLKGLRNQVKDLLIPSLNQFPLINEADLNLLRYGTVRAIERDILDVLETDYASDLSRITSGEIQRMKFTKDWVNSVHIACVTMAVNADLHTDIMVKQFLNYHLYLIMRVHELLNGAIINVASTAAMIQNMHDMMCESVREMQIRLELQTQRSLIQIMNDVNTTRLLTAGVDNHVAGYCMYLSRLGNAIVGKLSLLSAVGGLRGFQIIEYVNLSSVVREEITSYVRVFGNIFRLAQLEGLHGPSAPISEITVSNWRTSLPVAISTQFVSFCENHASRMLAWWISGHDEASRLVTLMDLNDLEKVAGFALLTRVCLDEMVAQGATRAIQYVRSLIIAGTLRSVSGGLNSTPAPPVIVIDQSEPELLLDSIFNQFSGGRFNRYTFYSNWDHPEGVVKVRYSGEQPVGVGPLKATISSFLTKVMDRKDLFEPTSNDKRYYKPAPLPADSITPKVLKQYEVIGYILGLAIRYNIHISLRLSLGAVELLRNPMFAIDSSESTAHLLLSMFQLEDPLGYANWDPNIVSPKWSLGESFRSDPNRVVRDIQRDFFDFKIDSVKHSVIESIRVQMKHVLVGLNVVIPYGFFFTHSRNEMRDLFSPADCGINVLELKRTTTYALQWDQKGPIDQVDTTPNHPTVEYLWNILANRFAAIELKKFMRFVSGSEFPPASGFGSQWMQVQIFPWIYSLSSDDGDDVILVTRRKYPSSQTCFNTIVLGAYDSEDDLYAVLREVIEIKDIHNQ